MKCTYANPCQRRNEATHFVRFASPGNDWQGDVCNDCLNTLKRRAWKCQGVVDFVEKDKDDWKRYGLPK